LASKIALPRCEEALGFLLGDYADEGDDILDLCRLQQAVAAKGRHLREAGLGMVGLTHAVSDRLFDGREVAAPQPVVVIEVGIAFRSCRAGAVALDAVDLERGRTARNGGLHQLFIALQLVDVGGDKRLTHLIELGVALVQLLLELVAA